MGTLVYENDNYQVVVGLTTRFVGPVDKDGAHVQTNGYQIINKITGVVERETFIYPQAIEDARYLDSEITGEDGVEFEFGVPTETIN